jgi:cysteine synthase
MTRDTSYAAVMARKGEIVSRAAGIDYSTFERGGLAFDYEAMIAAAGYDHARTRAVQAETKVGGTPLIELKNMTALARSLAAPGMGATIVVKDEAAEPSGSFKARRGSLAVHHAKELGYPGVIAATSGNYGAAVASQAAMRGLPCIVLQEVYDSAGRGQPEILEKGRACQAYGAEVIQLTVGPELFYYHLLLLEDTGYFNASLYTPFGVAGIETLGVEVVEDCRAMFGRDPDVMLVTHAGGGNVTGTARGMRAMGCTAPVVGVSVDLSGLSMASDTDFNRKSFTTGHTGFGVPFATWPDRADVPRNAARALRYLDRYVTVTQGEAFYITEALAQLEGLERGPAGNTSLAAAIPIARDLPSDAIVCVQETEYTGAGKHPTAQLTFAREMGVEVVAGDPRENVPGRRIVIPESPEQLSVVDVPLERLRKSYIKHALESLCGREPLDDEVAFLAEDTQTTVDDVVGMIRAAS